MVTARAKRSESCVARVPHSPHRPGEGIAECILTMEDTHMYILNFIGFAVGLTSTLMLIAMLVLLKDTAAFFVDTYLAE